MIPMATFTRMTSPQQRDNNVGAPDDEPNQKDRSDETDGPVFHDYATTTSSAMMQAVELSRSMVRKPLHTML
jgi:hypothetical protein